MKQFKKEIVALLFGMAFSYGWQLFGILMIYLEPNRTMVTKEMFIPIPGVMLTITPIIAWVVMGILRVTWMHQWSILTAYIFSFILPSIMLACLGIFLPILWLNPTFWVSSTALSIGVFFTLLKLSLKVVE